MNRTIFCIIVCCFCIFTCKPKESKEPDTFTDTRDGKIYKTVKIGEQVWFAENLNYAVIGSKCYGGGAKVEYEKDSLITLSPDEIQANCEKYGRLYSWKTAMRACPTGWHLPDSSEWRILTVATGGSERKAGKYLKATSGWKDYEGESGNGDDRFGFSALPGGAFTSRHNFFLNVGSSGYWWSASKNNIGYGIEHNYSDFASSWDVVKLVMLLWSFFTCDYVLSWVIDYNSGYFSLSGGTMNDLLSVRCLQNTTNSQEPNDTITFTQQKGTLTDTRDGKTYKTVKIGEQVWFAENLNYEAEGSRCYNDSTAYCNKYGRLYNWETSKIVCPTGWHLPSKAEWEALDEAVGGEDTADKYLKAISGWSSDRGEDKYGFSALPGGFGGGGSRMFIDVGNRGYWWSSSEHSKDLAHQRLIYHWYDYAHYYENSKYHLFSVRCVQDTPASPKGSAK